MTFVRRLTVVVAALGVAAWLAAPHVSARQAAPGAPATGTYLLNGTHLSVNWTHATGTFTHYQIDVGSTPGVPFLQFSTTAFANPSKLAEALASITNPGAPVGTFYVAIHGVNGAAVGPASPEITINIPGGCVAPGAPTNLTAIVRGTSSWMMWNPGSGGRPTSYILQASTTSGANFNAGLLGQAAFAAPAFNVALPAGTYYLRAAASNACGASGVSNEISVTAGVNTPARTPDPVAGGRLPQPDVRAAVAGFAQQAVNLGYLVPDVACPPRAGTFSDPIEARKVQPNRYINYVVDGLRTIDQRFGYNAKPTRAYVQAIIAGDEMAYHYGSDAAAGSPNIYIVDVLGGHCTGILGGAPREAPDYRPFYDEFGRWTSAGRF